MDKQKIVLLGLSGGVDSSIAAYLLKEQGYKVIAAFMKNFSDNKNPLTKNCNWVEERKMAQKIAAILEIPFITLDFEKKYKKQVIDPMFKSYEKGLTPNPDISCNTIIKFPLLWKESRKLKADYIATGHYARIKKTKKGFQLLKGKDKNKDQTYFLSELTQKDLSHTLFPIGELKKDEVRKIAQKLKLPNFNKPGTKGICFIGKVQMQKFLKSKIKELPGVIKNPEGQTIGQHNGVMFYTIGQRIGENKTKIDKEFRNKTQNKKWFVVSKNTRSNILIAAPQNHKALKSNEIKIKKLHLINPKSSMPKPLKARIRHLGPLHSGKLSKDKKTFILSKALEAIAPGQQLTLYHKDQLIASAEITN